jgi:N-acetylglutamate synthase-like GNAT family acetyltransferase
VSLLRAADADVRVRVIAFLRAIEHGCAERILSAPGGCAIRDSRHPRLWDANHLRVDASGAPDAADLDAAARSHFEALGFQMISVLDEAVGRELAGPLDGLGYRAHHGLLMVLEGEPGASRREVTIAEVQREELARSRIAGAIERGLGVEVGDQLVSRDALVGAVVEERCFAVQPGRGEVAARCQLYSQGSVAQIENVYTAAAHRRRGLSRTLVSRAAREARAAGATVVFLVADAAGWTPGFYRSAGFVDAGLLPQFVRTRG